MNINDDHISILVEQPTEGLHVELKTWLNPELDEHITKIVKAIFALRNRNGGFLVIGINDKTNASDTYPFEKTVEELYHIDVIQGLVSRYASTLFEVSVSLEQKSDHKHPVIVVPEGVRIPVVVKRELTINDKKLLKKGDLYFRTLHSNGTPSSSLVLPEDYQDLMEICFENREADIGRFLRKHLSGLDTRGLNILVNSEHENNDESGHHRAYALLQEGHKRFLSIVEERNLKDELEEVKDFLTMHVGLALDPPKKKVLASKEFFNLVSASNPRYTGRPIWRDSRNSSNTNHHPFVYQNEWQALIVKLDEPKWLQEVEFMSFDPNGKFYCQRVMQDDLSDKIEPKAFMDVELMIYRVTEVIAVGLSIARKLGWEEGSAADFAFRWTGLENRTLSPWVNPLDWVGLEYGKSKNSMAESYVSVPLLTSLSALAPHVTIAMGPLFTPFDGYMPSKEIFENCVQRLIERKLRG